MKYPSLLICLLTVSSGMKIDPQDNDQASRRLSYSTQVVHDDPKYPNEPHASSSINFKFNPSLEPSSQESTVQDFKQPYYRQPPVYTTARPTYHQNDYTALAEGYHLNYSPLPNKPSAQTQSFNVGYSMRFKNDQKKKSALPPPPPPVQEEIITGSRKEEVSRPNQHAASFIGDDFVRNSFTDGKKQKISGIKSKYPQSSTVNVNTKQLLAQANLSPKTQKQLAYLETAKTNGRLNLAGDSRTRSSAWQNLSPTVEIYHSKELVGQDGRSFDHSRALGKSEGFDHTNAVLNYLQNGGASYLIKPDLVVPSKKSTIPKLPIDISLLRDPFLTTDKRTAMSSGKTIPIHFDTTLIQEMNKHIIDSNSHADTSLETADGAAATNTVPIPYHQIYYHPLTAEKNEPMKYGFKPPMVSTPLTAQQFGFEPPQQMFSGMINKPQKPFDPVYGQRQVAYTNYYNQRNNDDFANSKQATFSLTSAEPPVIESSQYFSKDYSDYFKTVKGVENDFSGLPDPHKYAQTKDYDFQKEFDKVLFSSSVQPSENGHDEKQQQQESMVHYKGPATRDQFVVGGAFNRNHHQKNGSPSSTNKKREPAASQQHSVRQSRVNLKPRVVREYIETDLKPPPMQLNRDRNNNAHRRAQTVKYHV